MVGEIDGDTVGSEVVGETDGETVGSEVVGETDGETVGSEVVGEIDGDNVGSEVVGDTVGLVVGLSVRHKGVFVAQKRRCAMMLKSCVVRVHDSAPSSLGTHSKRFSAEQLSTAGAVPALPPVSATTSSFKVCTIRSQVSSSSSRRRLADELLTPSARPLSDLHCTPCVYPLHSVKIEFRTRAEAPHVHSSRKISCS